MAVLSAHGVEIDELAEASEEGATEALARLQRGELDAVFLTGAAPIASLQQFAVTLGMQLLSIDNAALTRILDARPGLARLALPPNTYPRQREPVIAVAATALLVTTVDAPTTEVERVSDLVFKRMPQRRALTAGVVPVSTGGELRGVTIPLHPGAARQSQ